MTEITAEKTDTKLREWSREINRGFLELWILNLLRRESLYGARICDILEEMTEGRIQLEPGTIYPLLNRLAERGWIIDDIRVRHQGRGPMRRYYRLTEDGSKLLRAMVDHYFTTFDAFFRMVAADFRSVRRRLFQLMEEME
ncbi:MAG: PadR family transcriptional regulator [Promethearchaeota archaeon]